MDLRTFLKIDNDRKGNFLFIKNALKWIPILEIKLEMQVQTTHPNPILCGNDFKQYSHTFVIKNTLYNTTKYCNTAQLDVTDTFVLEMEYFEAQENFDPQLVFSMLFSAVSPEALLAQTLRLQIIEDATLELIQSIALKQSPQVRSQIVQKTLNSEVLSIHNYSEFNPLTEKEKRFLMLWKYLDKYSRFIKGSTLNLTALRRFKLQQMLFDEDFKSISNSLMSASKLEVLDLSHNKLYTPKDLPKLLQSLRNLKVLDLSENGIPFDYFAQVIQFLSGLHVLDFSGNVLGLLETEGFDSSLKYLKELRVLDLSRIKYSTLHYRIIFDLQHLSKLQLLNLSYCAINESELEELATSLKLSENLLILDISHNVFAYLPDKAVTVLSKIRDVNLSSNALSVSLSELGLFRCSSKCKLKNLNLSNNFLCAEERELRKFLKKFKGLSELQEVDLTNNSLIMLSDAFWNESLSYSIPVQKAVKLDSTRNVPKKSIRAFAVCTCKFRSYFMKKLQALWNVCLGEYFKYESDKDVISKKDDLEMFALFEHIVEDYLVAKLANTNATKYLLNELKQYQNRINTIIPKGMIQKWRTR